jgi:hypothetical protein
MTERPELTVHGPGSMTPIVRILAGLAGGALVLVLAACSSSGPSLAQDQAQVNRWQGQVASLSDAVSRDDVTGLEQCHFGVVGPDHCTDPTPAGMAKLRADQQRLSAAQFQLQVAKDQLRKDTNG